MEYLIRDGFITNPLYLLPFIIVIGLLAVVPIMRLINAWLVERHMDIKLAVPLLIAHVGIIGVLWQMHLQGTILLYLLALLLQWAVTPLFANMNDWLTIRALVRRDIARYRYMLRHDPNNANALIGLANAYIQMGQEDEAIAAYEKAKAVDPQNTSVVHAKLTDLINSRVRKNIGKKGMQATTKDGKPLDLEQQITMQVVDKEDGPVIPEL